MEKNLTSLFTKRFFDNIKKGIDRFPITILICIINYVVIVSMLEMTFEDYNMVLYKNLEIIAKILSVGIPLSALFELKREKYFSNKNILLFRILNFIITIVVLYILNNIVTKEFYFYMLGFICILLFILLSITNKNEDNTYFGEKFVQVFVVDSAITVLFSLVLMFGLFAIIIAINALFFSIPDKIYSYTALFVWEIFAVVFFLARLKVNDEEIKNYKLNKIFEILIKFIIIPLIVIYTLILYMYLGKIIFTLKFPKGIVSHLVLWYTVVSVFIMVIIKSMEEKNIIFKNFVNKFPYFSIPLLILSFISISKRVAQYGITENRYYIIALGIWLVICMFIYIFKIKYSKVKSVILSFLVITVISLYSPFNAEKIGLNTQIKRLEKLFIENGILKDNKINKIAINNNKIKNELYTTFEYISQREKIEKIGYLKDKNGNQYTSYENVKNDLGMDYTWGYNINEDKDIVIKIYDNSKNVEEIFSTNGYENILSFYVYMYTNDDKRVYKSEKYKIVIDKKEIIIKDSNEKELAKMNIANIMNEVISSEKIKNLPNEGTEKYQKYILQSINDLEYMYENENIKYRLRFNYIEITEEKNNTKYDLNGILLFSEK